MEEAEAERFPQPLAPKHDVPEGLGLCPLRYVVSIINTTTDDVADVDHSSGRYVFYSQEEGWIIILLIAMLPPMTMVT